jgi:hypothetical protein
MNIHTIELTAPSSWASYLINGDSSGMDIEDKKACDAWLAYENLSFPVSCDDAGFIKNHDAQRFALASDCQTYSFLF